MLFKLNSKVPRRVKTTGNREKPRIRHIRLPYSKPDTEQKWKASANRMDFGSAFPYKINTFSKMWKVMFWETVFVNGPEENRVKPIPKCCFCTRSLGKQTESMRNLNFLQRSLGKQMKPIEKSWFGKSFLLTVLRKTEQNLFRNVVFAHGP